MPRHFFAALMSLAAFLSLAGRQCSTVAHAELHHGAAHGKCHHCGTACQSHQLVKCTIMVPMLVAEIRTKNCVVQTTKEKEETYTVFQRVPVTRKVVKERCYLDDEVREKMITETECHRVMNPIERVVHVKVPDTVICPDDPCGKPVTVLRDDVVLETDCVPDVVFEKTKREISYCVKVPKKETIPCYEETVYKLAPVEKTRTVQVCVPEIIKEHVQVTVQKMMPKTIYCCKACSKKLK